MFTVLNFFYKSVLFFWRGGWSIVSPNLNPLRHAPMYVKYFFTVFLGLGWSLVFTLYTAQFFVIGLNMLAHLAVISAIFITWITFKGVSRRYPDNYPLMRDPTGSPKCYEMTDTERLAAAQQIDQLTKQK